MEEPEPRKGASPSPFQRISKYLRGSGSIAMKVECFPFASDTSLFKALAYFNDMRNSAFDLVAFRRLISISIASTPGTPCITRRSP